MTTESKKTKNLEIEREIRAGREFTLADLIRQEGGNFLKGESPVPKLVQVITEINLFIAQNLEDSQGALQAILQVKIQNDQTTISRYLNTPLTALKEILNTLLNNHELFYEFVKQVDFKWGQMYGERPHFQQPGQTPHPEDEYTHESVKIQIETLLKKIENQAEDHSS